MSTEVKITTKSNITVHVDEQEPLHVEVKAIIPKGRGYYEVRGFGIANGEFVTFIINERKS